VNAPRDEVLLYGRANETAARFVAYFGSYLLWGTVVVIVSGMLMLG